MQAILFALIPYFGWGIGDVLGAKLSRKMSPQSGVFWNLLLQLLFFSFFIPFVLPDFNKLTLELFGICIVLGCIMVFGHIMFYKATAKANASVTGTIAGSFSAVSVVLAVLFLGETISMYQVLSIIVITSGIILSMVTVHDLRKDINAKGMFFAVLAMLAWGTYGAFLKIPSVRIGWLLAEFIAMSVVLVLPLFLRINTIELGKKSSRSVLLLLLSAAFFSGIANYSYSFAITKGLVAIVAPVASSYPTLYAPLAFLVFKDRITKQQILGIVITLIGIVFLSFFSI